MENKMKNDTEKDDRKVNTKQVIYFIGNSIFYLGIIVVLIYMYHFIDVQTSSFVYNQF